MTAFDYFLYDNKTLSRSGADWGIKAATGVLAERKDLREAFHDYCGRSHGARAHPFDFDAAVGGMPPASGSGYLLCVTFAIRDKFTRRSLVIVGLWCPDRDDLAHLIDVGDPVETARPLVHVDRPLAHLDLVPGPRDRGRPLRAPEVPTYLRFDDQSVALALALMDGAGAAAPPAILGVTGSHKLVEAASQGFRVIFCKPTDDRSEEVLASLEHPWSALTLHEREREHEREAPVIVLSDRTPIVARGPEPPELPMRVAPMSPPINAGSPIALEARSRARASCHIPIPEPEPGHARTWIIASLTFVIAIAVIAATMWFVVRRQGATSAGEPASTSAPLPSAEVRSSEPPATPRERLTRALDTLKALDPSALKESPGFVVAEHVDVDHDHKADREQVRRAYAALVEHQQHFTSPKWRDSLDYYLSGPGQGAPDAERLVAELLENATDGAPQCDILRRAFLDEVETPTTVAFAWCEAFQSLSDAARSLRVEGRVGS